MHPVTLPIYQASAAPRHPGHFWLGQLGNLGGQGTPGPRIPKIAKAEYPPAPWPWGAGRGKQDRRSYSRVRLLLQAPPLLPGVAILGADPRSWLAWVNHVIFLTYETNAPLPASPRGLKPGPAPPPGLSGGPAPRAAASLQRPSHLPPRPTEAPPLIASRPRPGTPRRRGLC